MRKNKKIFHAALALILALVLCLPVPQRAVAAKKKNKKPVITLHSCSNYLIPTYENYGIGKVSGLKKDAVVTVTSSDDTICTAEYDAKSKTIYAHALKPGTVTIKCTVTQGGKTYEKKCKYKILQYKNPLKSLKIGGKNYNSAFDSATDFMLKGVKGKQKISVKVGKGYKLSRIYTYKKGEQVAIKNGSKINLSKTTAFYIEIKNKKKNTITLGIYLS